MDDAACDVGKGNGLWILILAILGGGFSVILGGLVGGKTKGDMAEQLKWGVICMLLTGVFGIGWIMACCIACKTKTKSGD